MLTSGLDFAVQDLFGGSVKTMIRQEMERQLGAWVAKAMGLEQIKVDAVARVGALIDKFCDQALPQLGIPVSKELRNDIKASFADLIEGACSGALDPDGKLGQLIEVSNANIMRNFKGKIGSWIGKRLPTSSQLLEFETAHQWKKWTNARKLFYGRSGTYCDEVLEEKIEKAEIDLFCKMFCLGLLATMTEIYEEKGFFKKMLNPQRKTDEHLEYWERMGAGGDHLKRLEAATMNITKKSKMWNAHMPVLIDVLRTLGVAEGEPMQTLEIFRQIQFVPPHDKIEEDIFRQIHSVADDIRDDSRNHLNRLFRADEFTTFLPPHSIERGKKAETRYDQARGLGSVLETLTSVIKAQALTAIDQWVDLAAPGILKIILLDALGLDVDAPSRSVTQLSVALKSRLKKFHHMMATNHQVHFENGLKHWANHPSISKWRVLHGAEYDPTEGRDLEQVMKRDDERDDKWQDVRRQLKELQKLLKSAAAKRSHRDLLDLAEGSRDEKTLLDMYNALQGTLLSHDYFKFKDQKFGEVYVKMASAVFAGGEVAASIVHDVMVRKGVLSEGIMEWVAQASGKAVIKEVSKASKAGKRDAVYRRQRGVRETDGVKDVWETSLLLYIVSPCAWVCRMCQIVFPFTCVPRQRSTD
jgi:hypothetical protein